MIGLIERFAVAILIVFGLPMIGVIFAKHPVIGIVFIINIGLICWNKRNIVKAEQNLIKTIKFVEEISAEAERIQESVKRASNTMKTNDLQISDNEKSFEQMKVAKVLENDPLKARANWMQQQEAARYEMMMLEEMERRGIK